MMPTGISRESDISWTIFIFSLCHSTVECFILKRKTFTPAFIRAAMSLGLSETGPIVAIIFVFFIDICLGLY